MFISAFGKAPRFFGWMTLVFFLCMGEEILASEIPAGDSVPRGPTSTFGLFTDKATGDWGGLRTSLLRHGIEVHLANTGDMIATPQSGLPDHVSYSNLLEASLTINMQALANIPGGTAYLMALGTHGDNLQEAIQTIDAPSNLAADNAFRLFELWYEQTFFEDRIGVLVGLYAADAEFDAKDTAAVFINGAFGTGLDFSETGQNGPSIFPVTSLGVRVRANLSQEIIWRGAVLDGVPGDPDDPGATAIHLGDGDGLLILNELNYEPNGFDFLRLGLGGWLYTADFDDVHDTSANGTPVVRSGSHGIYGFLEGMIFSEPKAPEQGLSGFLRIGKAEEDVNQIGAYYAGGLVYTGLIPGRDQDVLGLGVSVGVNGDKFQKAQESVGTPVTDTETALELTYRAEFLSWFSFQPVLQYYINPGSDPGRDDIVGIGFRFSVNL